MGVLLWNNQSVHQCRLCLHCSTRNLHQLTHPWPSPSPSPLTPPVLQERALGEGLRRSYMETVSAVLAVTGHSRMGDNNPILRCAGAARMAACLPACLLA